MVRRHFDPVTGSPYWLKKAPDLTFDPRDITRYRDLTAFGPMPLGDLRRADPADLVPLAVARPLSGRIWESGGTTGDPCRVFYTESMLDHRSAWRRWALRVEGFVPASNWLFSTPMGPHVAGHGIWDLVGHGGCAYSVDFDPRWVKRMIRAGRLRDAQEYTDHMLGQILGILENQPITYIATTPALFHALVRRAPKAVAQLKGAKLSGTHATCDMYRSFREALGDDAILVITYGNTFGNTVRLPAERDGDIMPNVANYPQVTTAVVDTEDWTREVGFGEYGQVRLTVLHSDLFLPNILERDFAMRYDTGPDWPCDGVANVRPLQMAKLTPEGIY
jgi:hypothetical protein